MSFYPTDPALLTLQQTTANPGIATDLDAIVVENDNWYMLQEKGQRPTGPDDIMVKVFETIHKAALDAGRVVIAEPRSPMLDVSDWDVEVQVVKD